MSHDSAYREVHGSVLKVREELRRGVPELPRLRAGEQDASLHPSPPPAPAFGPEADSANQRYAEVGISETDTDGPDADRVEHERKASSRASRR